MRKFILIGLLILVVFVKCSIKKDNVVIGELDKNIVNNLGKYTVEIVSVNPELGRCSGVVIKEANNETHILTAKHCIDVTEEQYVENSKISLIFVSPDDDLALLIIDRKISNKKSVELENTNSKIGEIVYHIGFPNWDKTPYTSSGKILRLSDDWVWANFGVVHGSSGGGIFNSKNNLVGIVWGGLNQEDITVFEPIEDIHEFLDLVYRKLK